MSSPNLTDSLRSKLLAHDEIGLTEILYIDCLDLFTMLSNKPELSILPPASRRLLQEQAGRLYLWGEGFLNGKLDIIWKSSSSLHITVTKFLATIARILINRK